MVFIIYLFTYLFQKIWKLSNVLTPPPPKKSGIAYQIKFWFKFKSCSYPLSLDVKEDVT